MVEKILGVKLKPSGKRLIYTDNDDRTIVNPQAVISEVRVGALEALQTKGEDEGLVCYLTQDEFDRAKAQERGEVGIPRKMYSLGEVKQTVDLYLGVHNKFSFVLTCNLWRQARNFPGADLLETALIEFNSCLREYQRLAPQEVQQVQRHDIEFYARVVEGVKKSSAEDREDFDKARREYVERMRGR